MASYVYFKFKSQKEPQRVTIDGPHTDVWNLKREIITISRLGDGTDFDLKIYRENSNEEYTDDTEIIPKDSTVLARRLPASAPGKGRAARYVSGKAPISAKPSASSSRPTQKLDMSQAMTEEERLKAMRDYTEAQWKSKQEEMAHDTRVNFQGGKSKKSANVPEGEPPHGYICYRCGKKGHWIQACPTNEDANYDNRNRIKRTTGIPRSMLKKIEQDDIDKLDDAQRQNLMVNAEGEYVYAQADEKTWKKHLEQVQANENAKKSEVGNKELQERGLECPIDNTMFVDPMKTPCCGKTYCYGCIDNALIESGLTCPGCGTEDVSLERLEPDEEMKETIKAFQKEKSDEKQRSRSPSASNANTPKPEAGNSPRPDTIDGSRSPASANGTSKKRSADDVNYTSPNTLSAPAMKRQRSGEGPSDAAPQNGSKPSTPAHSTEPTFDSTTNMPFDMMSNMMPPDMSQMANMNGFNPAMMANMMGMGMMPGMANMMPNMMNMNGMMGMNPNMMNGNMMGMNNNNFNNTTQSGGWNNDRPHAFRGRGRGGARGAFNPSRSNNLHQAAAQKLNEPPKQPQGMSGVPTGPKGMASQPVAAGGAVGGGVGAAAGFYPPTGPGGGKFANQQRYAGKEEDNAYVRQPVNPQRQFKRQRGGGRMREADYREL